MYEDNSVEQQNIDRFENTSSKRLVVENAIELCMLTQNVPCLIGYTGVGKTDMGSRIAKRHNRNIIVLNLSIQTTEDLIGFPYRGEDNKMHWSPPAWFPDPDQKNKYILFVDEINRASKDVINAIMPMLLGGSLHEHTLPEGTWIMSAMNPDNDDFDMVYSFDDAAISSRLIHIEVPPEFGSWKTWLEENNKHDDAVVNFLNNNPSKFVPTIQNVITQNIVPNPRSWTKFIDVLHFCKENKIQPIDALCIIANGLLGRDCMMDLVMLLETYFVTQSIEELFGLVMEDNNALSVATQVISYLNGGKPVTSKELAMWFYNNVQQHPAILRKVMFDVQEKNMDDLYRYNEFVEAVSYMSKV